MNKIGYAGAKSISRAMEINSTLTQLDLGWNNIGAEGAKSISRGLENNSTLTQLVGCNKSDGGVIVETFLQRNKNFGKLTRKMMRASMFIFVMKFGKSNLGDVVGNILELTMEKKEDYKI